MKHSIMITVDGYSFQAVAHTGRTMQGRTVTHITTDNVPVYVLSALTEAPITVHDLLEVVRQHLNDTTTMRHECTCGPVEISWLVFEYPALRSDITARHSYAVTVGDRDGCVYSDEIGGRNGADAITSAAKAFGLDTAPAMSRAIAV